MNVVKVLYMCNLTNSKYLNFEICCPNPILHEDLNYLYGSSDFTWMGICVWNWYHTICLIQVAM